MTEPEPTISVIDNTSEPISNAVKLADLQDVLHVGLSWFLNGEKITPCSRLLHPFVERLIAVEWRQWVLDVQRSLQAFHIDRAYTQLDPLSASGVAQVLARGYAWMMRCNENVGDKATAGVQKRYQIKSFDERIYHAQRPYLAPILALWNYANRHLAELTYGVYLHGSMSTLDYVAGSSDVDTLVIVDRTTLVSPDRLLTLRKRLIHSLRWFYAIDRFQHHGYFVLTEFDLAHFDDALCPSAVFEYATTMSGNKNVLLHYRPVLRDVTIPFRQKVEMFRQSEAEQCPLHGWFNIKLYLQSMLLLPTLYLQALGKPVYKRDSFHLVEHQVPPSIWAIVQKGSAVRNLGWQGNALPDLLRQMLFHMPSSWVSEIIHRRLAQRMPEPVKQVLGNNWRREILDFVNYLADDLAKKGVEV